MMLAIQILFIGIFCLGSAMSKCDVLLIVANNYSIHVGAAAPFYRYKKSISDHFYTTSATEIGPPVVGMTGNYGYVYEGVACIVFDALGQANTVPFYRYINTGNNQHFYTINWQEIGTMTTGQVVGPWQLEGIAAYIYNASQPNTKPLYRYYLPSAGAHFYTISATEIGTTTTGAPGNYGYQYEGIAAYCIPSQPTAD